MHEEGEGGETSAKDVDQLLVSLASHHLDAKAKDAEWDPETVWREAMTNWTATHKAFAENEVCGCL